MCGIKFDTQLSSQVLPLCICGSSDSQRWLSPNAKADQSKSKVQGHPLPPSLPTTHIQSFDYVILFSVWSVLPTFWTAVSSVQEATSISMINFTFILNWEPVLCNNHVLGQWTVHELMLTRVRASGLIRWEVLSKQSVFLLITSPRVFFLNGKENAVVF